jgi:histone acetyltransferase (RNA polymerase elongator complex component)
VKRVIVPCDLGGSPTICALSPPRKPAQSPEVLEALIAGYAERQGPLEVGFYRGGIPSEELLAGARPHAIRLACSPADLDPVRVADLAARGLTTLELEVCTMSDRVLWALRRGYDAERVRFLVAAARNAGLGVGLVLVPGLPGHTVEDALDDARFAGIADFVRIVPALAFEGSDLSRWAEDGRYQPLELEATVAIVTDMVDIVCSLGTAVARVGHQPGPDGLGKVVAGPWHPNLRGLVETRRFRRRMEVLVADVRDGSRRRILLRVHPKDLSWAKGTSNENVRWLREYLAIDEVRLKADDTVRRGSLALG